MRSRSGRGCVPLSRFLLALIAVGLGPVGNAFANTSPCRLLAERAATLATAESQVSRQTRYVPYYQKNRIRYDTFKWHIYTTDHFEIFYYPEALVRDEPVQLVGRLVDRQHMRSR